MALTFTDRIVQYPNRYNMTLVSGTTYDLTPVPGTVTQQGTPLNAANLNALGNDMMEIFKANRGTEVIYMVNGGPQNINITNIDMDKYSYVEIKASSYRTGIGYMTTTLTLNGTPIYSNSGNSSTNLAVSIIIDRSGIVKHSQILQATYASDLGNSYEIQKEYYLYTKDISLISSKYYNLYLGADSVGGGINYLTIIGYK